MSKTLRCHCVVTASCCGPAFQYVVSKTLRCHCVLLLAVAERFALQHRSLYPHLSTARGEYVFTSHADCPLAVWDLRRMSVPVFASNSRNLDHQTEVDRMTSPPALRS